MAGVSRPVLVFWGLGARRDLWRISAWLAVVAGGGPAWLPQLAAAVSPYV